MKEYTNKYCNINILKFREGSVFKLYDGHTPKYSLNTNLFPVSYKYIYISKFVFILSILKIFIARCPTEDLTSVVTVLSLPQANSKKVTLDIFGKVKEK